MDTELLLTTQRFRVVRTQQLLEEGGVRMREIVRHPGAVVILPLVEPDKVCLIRNYRISVDQYLFELPAGTLEPPEPPEATAHRELIEETGYRAERLERLHAFYLSPGILDERMHLYLATGLTPGPTAREPGEQMENLVIPWEDAIGMIFSQQIQDAKTIAGLLLYDRLKSRMP